MFWIVVIFIMILLIRFRNELSLKQQFKNWVSEYSDLHDYDEDKIRNILNDIGSSSFYYSGDKIPYGRAKWFIIGDKNFERITNSIDELEYFGFTPIRSKEEEEFLEYGMLLTKDGIYHRIQLKNRDKSRGHKRKYIRKSDFFKFDGLWKVSKEQDEILLYYPTKVKQFKFPIEEEIDNFVVQLRRLISTGYTADLYNNFIEQEVEEYITNQDSINITDRGTRIGSIVGLNRTFGNHLKDIQFNATASANQAHGYAAEHANDMVDKVLHPFREVHQVGQDNAKNGADRRVGSQFIQTKYCSNARNTINAAFDKQADGGMYRYPNMQLEVPRDQYNDAIKLMKNKIRDGKVSGHTDPNDAYKIVKKGHVTYNEAKLIAKGGNLTSIKYDVLDGAIQSLPVAGISFVIVFAQAKWAGNSIEKSAKLAFKSSVKTMFTGSMIYAGSQQIGKVVTAKIVNMTGKQIAAETVARGAAGVISVGIVMGPDVFYALTGRISKQQLLKNSTVAGSGVLGAAALGTVVPGLGVAVVGATVATIGAKKILDHFIEDDRVEMFAILKEEFMDVVMSTPLSEEEFSQVQEAIFDKDLGKKLREMFKNKQSMINRKYTREVLVEEQVINVIANRPKIDENSVLEAVNYIENGFAIQ